MKVARNSLLLLSLALGCTSSSTTPSEADATGAVAPIVRSKSKAGLSLQKVEKLDGQAGERDGVKTYTMAAKMTVLAEVDFTWCRTLDGWPDFNNSPIYSGERFCVAPARKGQTITAMTQLHFARSERGWNLENLVITHNPVLN